MSANFCKILVSAGASVILCASVFAQEVGSRIAELKLVNGKAFTSVTVVRLDREKAVFKNAAGVFPLTYSTIAEPLRSSLLAARDGGAAKAEPTAVEESGPDAQKRAVISGVAFSGGLDQPYKFAAMRVVVVPKAFATEKNRSTFELGTFEQVAADTTTDIDGKFSVSVPPGEYVIFARQLRSYRNGNRVPFSWALTVKVSGSANVVLGDGNAEINQTLTRKAR